MSEFENETEEQKASRERRALAEALFTLLSTQQVKLMKEGDTDRGALVVGELASLVRHFYGKAEAEKFLDGLTNGMYSKVRQANKEPSEEEEGDLN